MVRKSKWISETNPDQPVSEVAARAFSDRLDAVLHYLPLAARHPEKTTEHVHQLRVATRRARAAVTTFKTSLPPRRAKRLLKALRKLRRAAGKARDLDVLRERVSWLNEQENSTDFSAALRQIDHRRRLAQAPLVKVHRKLRKGFIKNIKRMKERIRWRGEGSEPDFQTAAQAALQDVVGKFFAAAEADLSDIATLHQMRICGKQLRYAMEIFAGAFQPAFRTQVYPQIKELQDKLGAINDHASAEANFAAWLDEAQGGKETLAFQELLEYEIEQVDGARRKFLDWWRPQQKDKLRRSFEPNIKFLNRGYQS